MYGYKKKYTRKYARPSRKSKSFVKRAVRTMTYPIRKISNLIHTFRKEFTLPSIVSTGADQNLVYQFTANTLPEWPNFIELYDQYLINKIVLTFEPTFSGSNNPAIAPLQRWMRIVHDYDDANPLTTEDQYLDYVNCRSRLCSNNRIIRAVLYPKVLKPTYILGGSFQTQPAKSGWLDTDSYTVPHLGLKVFVPNTLQPVGNTMFSVRATYFLKLKNSR